MSWTNIGIGILCFWAIKNSSLGRRLYNIFKKQLSKDFVYIHKIVSLPLCIFLRREPSSSVDVNQVFVLCRTNSTDMTTGEELYCKMDGRRVRYNRWEKGEYMFVAKSKKWMRCYRWKDGYTVRSLLYWYGFNLDRCTTSEDNNNRRGHKEEETKRLKKEQGNTCHRRTCSDRGTFSLPFLPLPSSNSSVASGGT